MLAVVFAIGLFGNFLGYHGEEWQKYNSWNDARTYLFDYYGSPDYKDVVSILNRHNVSEIEYEAYKYYCMVEQDISPECAWELVEFAEAGREEVDFN